ncbi:MAG: Uncharacterised protein [Opitutia bacterium UBA7350]|nr:MAG: Uncharacterised protein [Opitutae bacterium UBA7350]
MTFLPYRVAGKVSSPLGKKNKKAAWFWVAVMALLIFAFFKNLKFYQAGLFNPNFSIIHEAFDFNFGLMPLLMASFAFLCFVFKLPTGARCGWAAFWILFLTLDLIVLRFYMTKIEPFRLEVRTIQILTPKLTEPIRIVHLSDIQAASVTEYEHAIFERVQSLKPDMLINTGDFLQVASPAKFEDEFPKLMKLMRNVEARYGSFAVFGDTDLNLYSLQMSELEPIKMLSSRSQTIQTNGGLISLHGLSLYQSKEGDWALRSIEQWCKEADIQAFKILIGHAPDFALAVGKYPIDLCLAGHTHGGQIRLPFWGPLVIDSAVPKAWSRGTTRIGVPLLNVSAGAGSNRFGGLPRLRFNCPTELTLIELIPSLNIR